MRTSDIQPSSAGPVPRLSPIARARGARVTDLAFIRPRLIWRYLLGQPASFWFINIYLFFEYVRPQQIYTAMGGFPYSAVSLFLALATLVLEGWRARKTLVTDVALIVFSAVLLLSCLTAVSPSESFSGLSLWVNWLLLYVLIAHIVITEKRFLIVMLAWLLYSFKMSQHGARGWIESGFGFRDWGATGSPGWFQNSGEFGIQMAMFIPLAFYFAIAFRGLWGRKLPWLFWVMVGTAVMSIIASSSRGAVVAMAGVVLWMLLQAGNKLKAIVLVTVFGTLVVFALPQEFRDRFDTIGEDGTSIKRENYWAYGKELMREHPVLGIGYNGWLKQYERTFGRPALPHNIYIQAGAEMGYLGLAAFLGLIASTLALNWRTRRLVHPLGEGGRFITGMAFGLDAAMVGFLIAGTFVTVLYYPFFWVNLALTTALHHSARDTVRLARLGHSARLVSVS